MPLDINLLTIKTQLTADSGSGERAESVKSMKIDTAKERAQMLQSMMPMLRENLFDRLNR